MKFVNKTRLAISLAIGLLFAFQGIAQTALSLGEVRKVEVATGKITIKHGEIKNLDMPPMTMVFNVKDKALLKDLMPGDQVRFQATSENGKIFITELVK